MPTLTLEYTTEAERLQYECLIAYGRELNRLGATAAPGAVLDTCSGPQKLERGSRGNS